MRAGASNLWARLSGLVQYLSVEMGAWTGGLLAMALMDPEGTHLVSLCPLEALGASFCPGCGLGHAVAYLARGAVVDSLRAHPLGIPAVLVLLVHLGRLIRHASAVRARTRPSP